MAVGKLRTACLRSESIEGFTSRALWVLAGPEQVQKREAKGRRSPVSCGAEVDDRMIFVLGSRLSELCPSRLPSLCRPWPNIRSMPTLFHRQPYNVWNLVFRKRLPQILGASATFQRPNALMTSMSPISLTPSAPQRLATASKAGD
jgi:hypothetical protein